MAFKFERLEIWQAAMKIASEVHCLTKTFPKEETFVLGSQIRRAADSIALNIAEGSQGQSDAEFKRFLGIALGSAVEVVACLHLPHGRGYLSEPDKHPLYKSCEISVKQT